MWFRKMQDKGNACTTAVHKLLITSDLASRTQLEIEFFFVRGRKILTILPFNISLCLRCVDTTQLGDNSGLKLFAGAVKKFVL